MILGWDQALSVDQRTIIHSPVEWILLRDLEFLRDEGDQQTYLVELRFHYRTTNKNEPKTYIGGDKHVRQWGGTITP